MKRRLLQLIVLTALVLSSTSCGIPQMLGRTVGNTVNKLGGLAGAAAAL